MIIAIAPGIAFALAIYLTDRYDREPLGLLIKIFLLGAISVIPAAVIESFLMRLNVFEGLLSAAFTAFIIAGFTEEYFKRKVVIKYALYNKAFNEKLDGIIYCAFSALGFATIENIMYVVIRFSANPYVGILRGVLSVPAHMLFGITMGYYLSLAKYAQDNKESARYYKMSLYVPLLLHGMFDFILMAGIQWLMGIFIPFVVILWVINLKRLNEYRALSKEDFRKKQ